MTQIIRSEDAKPKIILSDGEDDTFAPGVDACFGVVLLGGEKGLIVSTKFISNINKVGNFSVLSYHGFTVHNYYLQKDGVTIRNFVKLCLEEGYEVYHFPTAQELFKWLGE